MLFRVLGPLETRLPGQIARKPATLLASLLAGPGEWVSCDKLIDAIWHGQAPPVSARSNIKSYVCRLRRDLPPAQAGPRIEGRPGAYRIHLDAGELDVGCFRQLALQARLAMSCGDIAAAEEHVTEALALWRGTPFPELPAAPLVANLEETRWELREMLADALAGQARHQEAITVLRELTAEDPLREGQWVRLVRVLHQAGRRVEALSAYEHARTVLADELGVEPGVQLVEAHRLALKQHGRPRCELPRDVPDFAGRAHEADLLAGLGESCATSVPVGVIDGMPGVGKTALAVHVAHEIAENFPDGQLFVELGTVSAGDVLARLLRSAGVQAIPAATAERAAMWRAELAGRRVLLVLDDAQHTEQVEPLLPGSPGCMVLVTTRTRLLRLPAVDAVTLDPFGDEEAARFFAGDWRMGAAPGAMSGVVRLCGGLPAAIRSAAMAFRRRPKWTAHQFAAWLADEPAAGVGALIESACLRLAEPERLILHVVCSLPDVLLDVTVVAQAAGLGTAEARRRLEHLVDNHLLGHHGSGKYAVHRVVRDVAQRVVLVSRTA
jgi:DNA-binding SARP family transcriptional activator